MVEGAWLLPGTPYRDVEAVFAAIRHCLTTGVLFLGTCGGFQHAVLEPARGRAGIRDAAYEENDPGGVDPVIRRLACSLYGERRTVTPCLGTRFAATCGSDPFDGYRYCGCAVGRTRISFTSTCGGCERANSTARATSSGSSGASRGTFSKNGVSTMPGAMIVTRTPVPSSS